MKQIALLLTLAFALPAAAQDALPDFDAYPKLHAYNEFGEDPLYGPEYENLEYYKVDAPVGGDHVRAFAVVWQTFNPFGSGLGQPAPGIEANTYDTLMGGNADELFTAYVYMAEYFQIADDRSWMLFKVRDDATWWDGTSITARDVQFTFEKRGVEDFPGIISVIFSRIAETQVLDDNRIFIRFTEEGAADRKLPLRIGGVEIIPESFWADKGLSDALLEPMPGSGPYRVASFDLGEELVYELVEDYWGKDHPLNRGSTSYSTVTYDTIREREAEKIAFLARDLTMFSENTMERWVNGYEQQTPLIDAGVLNKQEIETPGLQGSQMAFFNLRNPKFQDPLVRRALALAFDFETMNEQFFFGKYVRNNSYYINHEPLTATGVPTGLELALLEKHAGTLSNADFAANMGEPWVNPVTNGGGDNFDQLDQALELFLQAGYTIDGDTLVNPEGEPYEILIEFYSPTFERIWQTYVDSLEQLGISVELKLIDQGVWFENLRTRNYEMISFSFGGSRTPGSDINGYFSTEFSNTPNSYGFAGVEDPFIDALVEEAKAADDLATLEAIGRLADRHLRNKNYNILFWNYTPVRLLWWDVFDTPQDYGVRTAIEGVPGRQVTTATLGWWYDGAAVEQLSVRVGEVLN